MEEYDLSQHDEDLTLLLHAWPDIEEALLREAEDDSNVYELERARGVANAVRHAFRVEVQSVAGVWDTEVGYVLLYDVNSYDARQAAAHLNDHGLNLHLLVTKHARAQGGRPNAQVQIVPAGKPIAGEVCPRVMATATATPDLRDLPEPEPAATNVPLIRRGLHMLTPIEAPFYDALQETDLVFAVQPRVQGDHTYRPDFIVFYGSRAVIVELDGHEGHKTKQQRVDDSKRDIWFKQKGLSTIRWTGTQVAADARGCVDQLMLVLRGTEARP